MGWVLGEYKVGHALWFAEPVHGAVNARHVPFFWLWLTVWSFGGAAVARSLYLSFFGSPDVVVVADRKIRSSADFLTGTKDRSWLVAKLNGLRVRIYSIVFDYEGKRVTLVPPSPDLESTQRVLDEITNCFRGNEAELVRLGLTEPPIFLG